MKISLVLLLLTLSSLLLSDFFGVVISTETLFQNCQPSHIKYEPDNIYCVRVIKMSQVLHDKNLILISRKNTDSNFGYTLNFPTVSTISQEEFDKLTVDWKPDGVTIYTFWNDSIFIPSKNIISIR